MKRTEAIAWLEIMKEDAIFEQNDALKMAIEALQTAEINCVHCPRYYETEDEIGVHSHCGNHGRLIDADALALDAIRWRLCLGLDCSLCPFYRNGVCGVRRMINDAPTVQADRPHGEWIDVNGDGSLWRCNQCKDTACCDGNFCLNCGARMKGAEHEID